MAAAKNAGRRVRVQTRNEEDAMLFALGLSGARGPSYALTTPHQAIIPLGRSDRQAARAELASVAEASRELARLVEHWHGKLGALAVETPDSEVDSMLNMWSAYNCLITSAWSRSASLLHGFVCLAEWGSHDLPSALLHGPGHVQQLVKRTSPSSNHSKCGLGRDGDAKVGRTAAVPRVHGVSRLTGSTGPGSST
jgi:hypothetical protein